MATSGCTVSHGRLRKSIETVVLSNSHMRATVLVSKGCDIYELRYLPRDVDVLWKSPWGLSAIDHQRPGLSSFEHWVQTWPGGWQVLVPNAGAECEYLGARLPFHGEASVIPWTCEHLSADDTCAEATFGVRLTTSPLELRRRLRLPAGSTTMYLEETLTNVSSVPIDYLWTHHPAFGAPFLSEHCVVDSGATLLVADDLHSGPHAMLQPGRTVRWGESGNRFEDPRFLPSAGQRQELLAYLRDFSAGWFAVTNKDMGFGFALAWPHETMPYACMWRELHANDGYPYYGDAYTMAIEPSTSMPGRGLAAVRSKTGTQRTLWPGQTETIKLAASFYESEGTVTHVSPTGVVEQR